MQKLPAVIGLVKEAAQTLLQLADLTVFALRSRPFELDEKTQGALTDETRARLVRLTRRLNDEPDWSKAELDRTIRAFAEQEGVGIGKFGGALRGTLSGGAPGARPCQHTFSVRSPRSARPAWMMRFR